MADYRDLSSVITGNLVTVRLAGTVIGLVQGINVNEDFGMQPVSGLGDILPVEFTPGMARIQISCSTVYMLAEKLIQGTDLGDQITNGAKSLDTSGIAPATASTVLRGRHFTIAIYAIAPDLNYRTSIMTVGKPLRVYTDCVYASGTISFQKHTMVMRDAQFLARDFGPGVAS
jgi:hypothetical protein